MTGQDRRFMGRAWGSLSRTRNIFGKFLLLALLQLIPILGQMIALGYFLGWLREAAWGMDTPLAPHVCGAGDADFWPRGAKAWCVQVLYGCLMGVIDVAGAFCVGLASEHLAYDSSPVVWIVVLTVVIAAVIVADVLLVILMYTGLVRLAIYNRFGAAWQWGVQMHMAGRDFGGLCKVFFGFLGISILLVLASSLISLPAVAGSLTPALAAVTPFVGDVMHGGESLYYAGAVLVGALGSSVAALSLVGFVLSIPQSIVCAVAWRALGNWACQFDVPRWGGMYDPLPDASPAGGPAPRSPEDAPAQVRPERSDSTEPQAAPASEAPAADAVGQAQPDAAGEAPGLPAPSDGAAPDSTTPPDAADAGAQGGASGAVSHSAARAADGTGERRGHPILVIVACYAIALAIGAACAVLGATSFSGSQGVGSAFGTSRGVEGVWGTDQGVSFSFGQDGSFVARSGSTGGSVTLTGTYEATARDATADEKAAAADYLFRSGDRSLRWLEGPLTLDATTYEVTLRYAADEGASSGGSDAPQDETVTLVVFRFFGVEYGTLTDGAGNVTEVVYEGTGATGERLYSLSYGSDGSTTLMRGVSPALPATA